MRPTIRLPLLALALALCLSLSAVPATALIACEDCEPGGPWSTRCAGICDNGWLIWFCGDWFAYGCTGGWLADGPQSPDAEERFIRSLLAQPAEGAPAE